MPRTWTNAAVDRDWSLDVSDDRELHKEIHEMATSITTLADDTAIVAGDDVAPRVVREVETAESRYLVRGEILRLDRPGLGPVVIIALERLGSQLPPVPEVRMRFGLTKKQAEVALLLAQRKSNQEIASALFISPHTARHHTERVLTKLGVHARTDVREALVRN
jgi:DNA-binding CsgD family transcriptional regulator